MDKLSSLLLVVFASGCTTWPTSGDNPYSPPNVEQWHELEHHGFELQLLATRGAKMCLPGQYQQLANLHSQASQEALAGFKDDADVTLLAYQTQFAKIQRQMDWLEHHTECLDTRYSEIQLRDQFLLLMRVDNQFAFNRAELLPDYQQALRRAATILKRQEHWHLQLTGHTDTIGSAQSNYDLGMQRAYAVRRYLVAQGADTNQIAIFSAGESESIEDPQSRTQRLSNRKVEAQVLVDHHTRSPHRIYSLSDWHAVKSQLTPGSL
ncbi:OmpA family protein [Photobacterium sanctipauli]|uniref:OmpA family protein n=1 Tax=Photobacterium sanctipauli TaxID=1342794 RepID=A0A2T3NSG3_9GAMM|nr:OmpA family protein [Photobacterium sanctipauli]PSW19161.1 OmpA family protein [Photobacterium sanctipauli]